MTAAAEIAGRRIAGWALAPVEMAGSVVHFALLGVWDARRLEPEQDYLHGASDDLLDEVYRASVRATRLVTGG